MIRIGIELNSVVRNINFQIMKYYKKDIKPDFNEEKISPNRFSIIEDLEFNDKKSKNEFMFIDYPYEIFGCAKTMERNLSVDINNWLIDLQDKDEEYEVSFFSLRENDLSIPSTYYFLSKIATRVRNMTFPKSVDEVCETYDIIITANKDIVSGTSNEQTVVLIEKEDNENVKEISDYTYKTLTDALTDNSFIEEKYNDVYSEIEEINENLSIYKKIKKWFKKI